MRPARLPTYSREKDEIAPFAGWCATGDTGSFLRTTMGALSLFGVPPEEYWAYDVADFDKEPTAFCYAFASIRVNSESP